MAIDFDAVVLGPVMGIFGGEITYYPASALGRTGLTLPDAVFDEAYLVVTLDGDVEVSTVMPVLGVRTAHFSAMAGEPARNGQVEIPGHGAYVVRDVQPDGQGHALLMLNLIEPG
jgi:hypothetical protein